MPVPSSPSYNNHHIDNSNFDVVDHGGFPSTISNVIRTVFTMTSLENTSRGRNIVLCLDGTKNHFSSKNSNLIKLFSVLEASENQLVYYDSGVGTYLGVGQSWWTGFKKWLALTADLAFAW